MSPGTRPASCRRGGLSLNAGFEWDWDNTPAEDADKSDYRYILSIGYGF